MLEYIPGETAYGQPPLTVNELKRLGGLIRQFHDAVESFVPPPDAQWDVAIPPDQCQLVCHNDLAPWNLVRDGDRWVFIDWDGAGPASRLWDLGYAAHGFVPLHAGNNPVLDSPRLRALADGYGLDEQQRKDFPALIAAHTRGMVSSNGRRNGPVMMTGQPRATNRFRGPETVFGSGDAEVPSDGEKSGLAFLPVAGDGSWRSEQDLLETGADQKESVSLLGPRRHGVRRNRSLRADVTNAWRANRHALLVGALGTIGLRIITEWVGLVSEFGVNFPHEVAKRPSLLSQVWGHWDAGYYLSVAQYGYAGRTVTHGQAANAIAFAPLYPWGIRLVHAITPFNWLASAELLSAFALFVSIAALYRLASWDGGSTVGGASTIVLLAFPTAFFLLAPYPESLALAFVTLALVGARSGNWLFAGVMAAGATLTKYYLVIVAVALCFEVLQQHRSRTHSVEISIWRRDAVRYVKLVGPTAVAMGAWMIYQQVHLGNPLAFAKAQSAQWNRHFGAPWTLAYRAASDLVHWRFLDTSTASVTELFDSITVVLLAGMAIYLFLKVRRSYGVLLGLGWCVFTFETYLLGVTREVLVLAPLFVGLGIWTSNRRWLERIFLVLFIPCSYFLIQRFATGAFAG